MQDERFYQSHQATQFHVSRHKVRGSQHFLHLNALKRCFFSSVKKWKSFCDPGRAEMDFFSFSKTSKNYLRLSGLLFSKFLYPVKVDMYYLCKINDHQSLEVSFCWRAFSAVADIWQANSRTLPLQTKPWRTLSCSIVPSV